MAFRFLVALPFVQDLLLCAKHLFIAARTMGFSHHAASGNHLEFRRRQISGRPSCSPVGPGKPWGGCCAGADPPDDTRAKAFGSNLSVELDAIEPNQLRALVQEAIELLVPVEQFEKLKVAEESERDLITRLVGQSYAKEAPMIDTFPLVLRTRVRARHHIEDGLPQWMVTPRAYPNRRLREPFRAPKKIHRQNRQPVRQGNTLLVRQFAATAPLHLLQERPLDRIGGGLVCGFAFVAVAPLLLGGREGHAAYAGMVTLASSSPVPLRRSSRREGRCFH